MGKQNRRRRRGRGSGNNQVGAVKEQKQQATTSKGSVLLQRLRHADAQTRHAALVVVLSSPASLSKRHGGIELLQAVRERIMDQDLECAHVAAACLSKYLTQTCNHQQVASWTVVLLERLAQCGKEISRIEETKATPKKRPLGSEKQWWVLTGQCLQTLCVLMETNSFALQRFAPSLSPSSSNDSVHPMNVLFGLMNLAHKNLTSKPGAANAGSLSLLAEDVLVYATRTMHSVLDDNMELLESHSPSNNGVDDLPSLFGRLSVLCRDINVPILARLHCLGCLVTARQLLLRVCTDKKNQGSSQQQQLLLNHLQNMIVGNNTTKETTTPGTQTSLLSLLLLESLDFPEKAVETTVQRYRKAWKTRQEEKADDEMEQEIIRKVNRRKEPARLIARRQKALKEQSKSMKKEKSANDGMQDDPMEDDDDDEEKVETPPTDARDQLAKAREMWNDGLVLPLQLALEVTANLTSVAVPYDDVEEKDTHGVTPMEEDDADIAWGPDQEAQLLAEHESSLSQSMTVLPSLDAALVQATVQSGIPNRLLDLLKRLCSSQPKFQSSDSPKEIQEDIQELQSKCGACLGNCLTEHFAAWNSSSGHTKLWSELRAVLDAVLRCGGDCEDVANAMVVALRCRSDIRQQIQPDDLDFLIGLATGKNGDKQCQREAVEMLGILCSLEPHPQDVNQKVCSALIGITTKKSSLLNEILNALMDIYGDDDCHPAVFDSLNVLGYFQRMLPTFKRLMACDRDDAEDQVEQWKETALNTSRFIRYKKGQL